MQNKTCFTYAYFDISFSRRVIVTDVFELVKKLYSSKALSLQKGFEMNQALTLRKIVACTTWLPVSRKYKKMLCLLSTQKKKQIQKQKQKEKQRDSSERTSVSSKTNLGRNTNSARLIIQVRLYHLINKQLTLFHCVSFPYHDTTHSNVNFVWYVLVWFLCSRDYKLLSNANVILFWAFYT